jgi:hypothetical protein
MLTIALELQLEVQTPLPDHDFTKEKYIRYK